MMNKSILLFVFCLIGPFIDCESQPSCKQLINELYRNIDGYGGVSPKEHADHDIALTYGEIIFESAEQLIKELAMSAQDVFYDLGCGVGKLVTQVACASPAKKVVGIELVESRYKKALEVLDKLPDHIRQKITFIHDNVLQQSYKDATIVFMCSTCFTPTTINVILEKIYKETGKNIRLVTLTKFDKKDHSWSKHFKLEKDLGLAMTWHNEERVYIYGKKNREQKINHRIDESMRWKKGE